MPKRQAPGLYAVRALTEAISVDALFYDMSTPQKQPTAAAHMLERAPHWTQLNRWANQRPVHTAAAQTGVAAAASALLLD
jgi:hypothetical protein